MTHLHRGAPSREAGVTHLHRGAPSREAGVTHLHRGAPSREAGVTHLHRGAPSREAGEADDVAEEDRHLVVRLSADPLRQLQLERHRLGQHLVEQLVRLLLLPTQLLRLLRQPDGVLLDA